jgi:hypothetical protein
MLGQGGRGTRARVAAVTLALGLSVPCAARADPATDKARAADAYERGRIANERGDFARAARELALADSILPDPVTLRAALHAATLADDPVLGTELLERAARRDKGLAEAVAEARVRFAHRTGHIVVLCPAGVHCVATVDGEALSPSEPRVVAIGVHTVGVQGDGPPEQRMLEVAADETVSVQVPSPSAPVIRAPEPLPEPRPSGKAGISPLWFAGAGALTAALGAVTIVSAVDTANRHSQFDQAGCESAPNAGCASLRTAGTGAQARTDALLVATGVLAAGSAALGIFLVRWTGGPEVSVAVRPGEASLRASF